MPSRIPAKGGLLKTFGFLLSTACCFAQANVPLGAAGNFAVLACSTVTNTGTSMITGDIGVSPGTVMDFPRVVVPSGDIHAGDGTAARLKRLTAAYMNASNRHHSKSHWAGPGRQDVGSGRL